MANLVEIVITGRNLARTALATAEGDARGLNATMKKLGTISGVALAGIAAESTKMAVSFEAAGTRLVTSAGESTKNIDMVKKGMLDMAGQVGIGATELAKGMYTVESAGYHGADGLKVLKAAAQGAKAENADLATVSNAVTDALTDYHLKASDSAKVTSQLITAVSHGKTSFEEFSGSMSTVLPLAGTLHIKLADVTGVMATMTAHGVSAAQASQNIANAMRHLASPTGTMQKEFAKMGITTKEVTEKLSTQGLAGTMEFLSKTAEKAGKIGTPAYTQALYKLMGSASGLSVALQTTGENAKQTQSAIKDIAGASADAKGNVKGFAEVQDTLKQKFDEVKASADTLMIELGTKLLPPLSKIMDLVSSNLGTIVAVAGAFAGIAAATKLYAIASGAATVATQLWAVAQGELDLALVANPIGLVVVAIAALAAGIVYAWKTSSTFRSVMTTTWNDIEKAVGAAVVGILKYFKFMFDAWTTVVGGIIHGAAKAFGWVPGLGGKLKAADKEFQGLKDGVDSAFDKMSRSAASWGAANKKATSATITQLSGVVSKIKSVPSAKSITVKALTSSAISALKAAGYKVQQLKNHSFVISAGTGTASSHLSQLQKQLNDIRSKTIAINIVTTHTSTGQTTAHEGGRYAHGGVVGAAATGGVRAGNILVGENGPEIVKLPAGSTVRSNPDSQRWMSENQHRSNATLGLTLDSRGSQMDRLLISILKKAIRVRGGNVQYVLGT